MIVAAVPLPDELVPPDAVLARPASTHVETLRVDVPLGADLSLWTGMAVPHHDRRLGERFLVTLSVRSAHEIGDARSGAPDLPFPRGALAVIDPNVMHWLVPWETPMPDAAGRIALPLWVGLQREIPCAEASTRVPALVDALGGRRANERSNRPPTPGPSYIPLATYR